MAVVASLKRIHVLKATNGTEEIGTATLTGTYVTGGFTVALTGIFGSPGTSPYGGQPIRMEWDSPLGYVYVTTFGTGPTSQVATVKVFSAANTELANGAAVEASVPFDLTRRIATA